MLGISTREIQSVPTAKWPECKVQLIWEPLSGIKYSKELTDSMSGTQFYDNWLKARNGKAIWKAA